MTPPTFDDRARALTQALVADAARIPARTPLDRRTSAPWKAIAVFAGTVVVISGAVVGASIALRGPAASHPAPAIPFGHWRTFQLDPNGGSSPDAVSCPDVNDCVAVDYGGNAIVSTNPGGGASAWALSPIDPIPTIPGYGPASMTGVSCPDPSFCAAVDQSGNVVTSTDPHGGTASWMVSSVDHQAVLSGISCPDEHLCVAVGSIQKPLGTSGVVLTSEAPKSGPGTWKVTELDNAYALTAVACPSSSFCVATDASGDVLTSSDPTGGARAWRITNLVPEFNSFSAISCPTTRLCVAVTQGGEVVTSTNPTGPARAWTVTSLDGSILFDSVSCAGTRLCVVGGLSDHVYMTTDPTGGSGAWDAVRVVPQGEAAMFGLDCISAVYCVGVDGSAGIHIYTGPNG